MKKWMNGFVDLVYKDLIAFYSYFLLVLSELVCLWVFFPKNTATPFTWLIALYSLNILVAAYNNGRYDNEKKEMIFMLGHAAISVILVIIGIVLNFRMSIKVFFLPLVVTALCVFIRMLQMSDTVFDEKSRTIMQIKKFFENKLVWVISQILIIGVPFGMFAWSIFQIKFHIVFKLLLIVAYIILIPAIVYLEDVVDIGSIFDIASETIEEEDDEEMSR